MSLSHNTAVSPRRAARRTQTAVRSLVVRSTGGRAAGAGLLTLAMLLSASGVAKAATASIPASSQAEQTVQAGLPGGVYASDDALAQAQTLLESTAYLAPVCGIADFITALSKKPKGPGLATVIIGAAEAANKTAKADRACEATAQILGAAAYVASLSQYDAGYVRILHKSSRTGIVIHKCTDKFTVGSWSPVSSQTRLEMTFKAVYTC